MTLKSQNDDHDFPRRVTCYSLVRGLSGCTSSAFSLFCSHFHPLNSPLFTPLNDPQRPHLQQSRALTHTPAESTVAPQQRNPGNTPPFCWLLLLLYLVHTDRIMYMKRMRRHLYHILFDSTCMSAYAHCKPQIACHRVDFCAVNDQRSFISSFRKGQW